MADGRWQMADGKWKTFDCLRPTTLGAIVERNRRDPDGNVLCFATHLMDRCREIRAD